MADDDKIMALALKGRHAPAVTPAIAGTASLA
jgi:hypothetical protein